MLTTYQDWFAEFKRIARIAKLCSEAVDAISPTGFKSYYDAKRTPAQAYEEWIRDYMPRAATIPAAPYDARPVTADELLAMAHLGD